MSNLYQFTPATDDLSTFLSEAIALGKEIKADPVNRAHVTPLLGLSGSVSKAVDGVPDVGPFGASAEPVPESLEDCCDRIVDICERVQLGQEGYAAGGLWLRLLAPVLIRLIDRLVDRFSE